MLEQLARREISRSITRFRDAAADRSSKSWMRPSAGAVREVKCSIRRPQADYRAAIDASDGSCRIAVVPICMAWQ
jgi:hypothetical protein